MSTRTNELVKTWKDALACQESQRRLMSEANNRVANTTNELGKHIAPDDMTASETIAIWVRVGDKREELVEVKRDGGTFTLNVRGKGRDSEGVW